MISGQELSCVKQQRTLFSNVNFSVDASQMLYIRGQNGAGKTSLLRIIVGLSEAESGRVLFNDRDIHQDPSEFHAALVYFGHKLGLNLSLTALENLDFWCKLHGFSVTQNALFSLLATLGLVGLEDLPVSQLSAGQQRRVALARLWLKKDAKLWVLDEPFTALDVQGIELLRDKIVHHLHQGGAVIATSHQQLDIPYPTQELDLEYRI